MRNWLLLLMSVLLLAGCANKKQSEYLLTDSTLRTFQGGDYNTYAVLNGNSDKLEEYTESLQTQSLLLPNMNSGNILIESYAHTGNLINPFTSRLFKQDDAGNLLILGVSYQGVNYWLVDDQLNVGQIFLPANLSDLSKGITISSPLKQCVNKICQTSGQLDINLTLDGTDTVKTNYAQFETYKVSIQWDLSLYDNNNANTSITIRCYCSTWKISTCY